MSAETATRLCSVHDVPDGEARRFDLDGHRIAVVRLGDDFYAIGDRCSHQDISLSEGEVDAGERTLECWKHGSTFSLETGEPLTLPATKPVPTYDVQVRLLPKGGWTDWKVGTSDTGAWFGPDEGKHFAFRVRGRDWAGNQEPWPEAADMETTQAVP